MKKSTAKLQLKKSVVRVLQDGTLATIVGGGSPSNEVILCSHSCHCPPIVKGGGTGPGPDPGPVGP
jgi:hypothetical protein